MMLDTSYVVDLLRERSNSSEGPATSFLRRHRDVRLRLPVFVLCELHLGVERARNSERERLVVESFCEYAEATYPAPGFATIYAQAVASLLTKGVPIPVMDALIASLAIQYAEPVVTRDVKHFRRVPGLVVSTYRSD